MQIMTETAKGHEFDLGVASSLQFLGVFSFYVEKDESGSVIKHEHDDAEFSFDDPRIVQAIVAQCNRFQIGVLPMQGNAENGYKTIWRAAPNADVMELDPLLGSTFIEAAARALVSYTIGFSYEAELREPKEEIELKRVQTPVTMKV